MTACEPWHPILFNAFLRIPAGLLVGLLASSGDRGIYFEPRGEEARLPSKDYVVTWLPKLSRPEVLLAKQSHDKILGLARVGSRFGVRCAADAAEAVHQQLKPSSAFVKTTDARVYHSGPWPYGSQRVAIAQTLADWGWEAKPLQPIPRPSGSGQWWSLRAATAPPSLVMHLRQGEVLFSEAPSRAEPRQPPVDILVAPQTVLKAVATKDEPGEDPLMANDPWASALATRPLSSAASAPRVDMQAMAKTLEAKFAAQIKTQVAEATHGLSSRVQGLETTVEQVSKKVDDQEANLSAMFQKLFEQQTNRIEELLAPKRQRQE